MDPSRARSRPAVRALVLDELAGSSDPLTLTEREARYLRDSRLVDVRATPDGRSALAPCGQVGAVRVGDLQVEVRPKDRIGLANLLFFLGYAQDPGFRDDLVVGDVDADLWPALAYSLAASVERALERGVLQGYLTVEEALRTVRGRIRFGDQLIRHPGRMVPIEVTHDEYSADIAENRLVRAALTRMLAVPGVDPPARRRLLHLVGRLEGVAPLPLGSPLPRWAPTRLNTRYHGALRLCELILRHVAARVGGDGIDVASFVVTMPQVFEDFVTLALREALRREPGATRAQYKTFLAGEGDWRRGDVPMWIDLAHVDRSGRPRLIFDAKYKYADGAGPNADLYQMLAYSTALAVPDAWLVYADGSRGAPQPFRIKNTEVTVWSCSLDLAQHPREVLGQVDAVAREAVRQSLRQASR